jgi:hypothetical protein
MRITAPPEFRAPDPNALNATGILLKLAVGFRHSHPVQMSRGQSG